MPYLRFASLTALVVAIFASAQSQPSDQTTIMASAQKSAVRALNFRQGEVSSLTRVHGDFTPEGWKDFMKHMEGFLDQNGAPTFNSSFVPSKDPVFLDSRDGVVHFRILGTLTQSQNQSRTTYRAAIEVYALRDLLIQGGSAIKIQHLEQITCSGASTVCQ